MFHGSWVTRLQTLKDDGKEPDTLAVIAVAGILASDADDSISPKLRETRRVAILQEFADLVNLENHRGIAKCLLIATLEQKIGYLLNATSATQVKKICMPQFPSYDINGKVTNGHPYPILEEEAIGWSLAVFHYPPTREQLERWMDVMREISRRHPDVPGVRDWNKQLESIMEESVY